MHIFLACKLFKFLGLNSINITYNKAIYLINFTQFYTKIDKICHDIKYYSQSDKKI